MGEPLVSDRVYYQFDFEDGGLAARYANKKIRGLIENGIYGLWDKWYIVKNPKLWQSAAAGNAFTTQNCLQEAPSPWSIGLNFHMLGFGCLVETVALILEIVYYLLRIKSSILVNIDVIITQAR